MEILTTEDDLQLVDPKEIAQACADAGEASFDDMKEYLENLARWRTVSAYDKNGQKLDGVENDYYLDYDQLNRYLSGPAGGDGFGWAASQVL